MLAGSVEPSDRILVSVNDNRLNFEVESGAGEAIREEAKATHSA